MINYSCIIYTYSITDEFDHKAVTGYLEDASANWQAICRNLYLSHNQIDVIDRKKGNASDHLADGITEWLTLNYKHGRFGKPTWKMVADSVYSINNSLFLRIASQNTKG